MSLAFSIKISKLLLIQQIILQSIESALPGSQYSKPELLKKFQVAKSWEMNYTDTLTIKFESSPLNNEYKYLCADTFTLAKRPMLCKFEKGGHLKDELCLI